MIQLINIIIIIIIIWAGLVRPEPRRGGYTAD